MSEIRQTGKTVEDAIASALEKLNALRDEVDVQVITKGKKGFLGFGAVPAEVSVKRSLKPLGEDSSSSSDLGEIEKEEAEREATSNESFETPSIDDSPTVSESMEDVDLGNTESSVPTDEEIIAETSSYIKDIATEMGIEDLQLSCETDGKVMNFHLESEKAAFLIGKRGTTLNSLQQLAQLVANKGGASYKIVKIDVGDYRYRREQALEQLADRMADKAARSGRKVKLEPMPSNERKVLHNALADRLDIETYSEGKDPRRYIVIEPIV